MNEHDKNCDERNIGQGDESAADRLAIELLVDGELDEDQRRQLLSALDYKPDGWRQLALAFVEAQTLRQELSALVRPARADVPRPSAAQQPLSGSPSWSRAAVTTLATAASFMVALGIGFMLQSDQPSTGKSELIVSPADDSAIRESGQLVDSAQNDPISDVMPLQVKPQQVVSSNGNQLAADDENLFVSVREGRHDEDVWSQVKSSALPPHIRQRLEQLGHRIKVRRTEVTQGMSDGRRVTVPVEEFEVQFVGDVEYQ